MNFKNIVLSGGSVKGFSYIGVQKSLEENDIIEKINCFVGTSIGSIFATLFSMGFTSQELEQYLHKNIEEIHDIDIDNIYNGFGIWSGKEIINIIEEIISQKYRIDITFEELYFLRNKELIICVTNLNEYKIEYLSHKTYKKMKIIDAIRFAITIPFIFTSLKYENKVFIDACVIEKMSFYNLEPNETLGIILLEDTTKKEKCEINNIEDFTKNLMICLNKNHVDKYDKKYNVVEIVCNDIDLFDFTIKTKKKIELVECGYKSLNYYLKKIK
jgi:predicted acylesterase/phospholipase RssA